MMFRSLRLSAKAPEIYLKWPECVTILTPNLQLSVKSYPILDLRKILKNMILLSFIDKTISYGLTR